MSPAEMQRAGDGLIYSKNRADAVLICLVVLAVLLITAAVYWTLGRIESQIKTAIADSLRTIVATSQEGIGLWVNTQKNPVSLMARRAEVISAVKAQTQLPPQPAALRNTPALRDLRQFLGPVLDVYKYDFCVVDRNGIQIAAEADDQLGKKFSERAEGRAVQDALMGQVGFALYATDGPNPSQTLIVAAPIADANDHVIAALVFFLDPKEQFNLITHLGRIGASGETYAFDRNGRMLTTSRFRMDRTLFVRAEVDGPDAPRPFTRMAESALAGNSGVDVNGYPDYRGVLVFGAWSWDPSLGIGIAAEIDRSEALTPYRSIRALTFLMLLLILGAFAVLLAVIRHRNRILASNYAFREAIKARQDTLAVVSHDLRAPLNNVLLCSNLISKSVGDSVAVERFVGMINRTSRQMEKLISDLLDVSEMEMGRVRTEKRSCDICSVIDPVRDIFAEQAKSKSIQFDVSCPDAVPVLMIDPDRMIQVMSNLVGNALKFTPSGGRVSLNVARLPREVRLEVRDTGPGISEEARPHIFEQFWKTPSSGKRGRGLGLYIARMIVEAHNGKIWVESDGRTGSTFFVTLPLFIYPNIS